MRKEETFLDLSQKKKKNEILASQARLVFDVNRGEGGSPFSIQSEFTWKIICGTQ